MGLRNVDIARRMIDAWNRRDVEAARAELAPDVEWRPVSPTALEGTVYRGHDEMEQGARELWETWEVFRFEESEIREHGDDVVWLGHVLVRGSGSSVEFRQEIGNHMSIRDGKVTKASAFLSWDEAIASASLPSSP